MKLEKYLAHGLEEILVEEVVDDFCDPDIIVPAVDQHQFSQHLELSYCEIADLHCSPALVAEEADADIGLLDHVAVVGAVADGQCYFVPPRSHQTHHLRFLFRSAPAADYRLTLQQH